MILSANFLFSCYSTCHCNMIALENIIFAKFITSISMLLACIRVTCMSLTRSGVTLSATVMCMTLMYPNSRPYSSRKYYQHSSQSDVFPNSLASIFSFSVQQ